MIKQAVCDRCAQVRNFGEFYRIGLSVNGIKEDAIDLCPRCYREFRRFYHEEEYEGEVEPYEE
jgi:hypothetical protein